MGRWSLEFWPWLLSCVTQATFLKSVILNFLICKMRMMTSILLDCMKDQMSIHIYILYIAGSQYIILKIESQKGGDDIALKSWK